MEELNQELHQAHSAVQEKSDALDCIVAMAEQAARTIEQLRQENARLTAECAQAELQLKSQQKEVGLLRQQLCESAKSTDSAQNATAWYSWFHAKFGDSIFYSDIQKTFLNDHRNDQLPRIAALSMQRADAR